MLPDGQTLAVGDGDGRISMIRAALCLPSPTERRCFGGYMVWRSRQPDGSDKELLRSYIYGDSSWTFDGRKRAFADPESILHRVSPPLPPRERVFENIVVAGPVNGVPYYYSLTRFDRVYLSGGVFDVLVSDVEGCDAVQQGFYHDPNPSASPSTCLTPADPTPIVSRPDARPKRPLLGDLRVVPNPFERGKTDWELPGEMHVEFQNLPDRTTIRIFSVGGDFIRELDHAADRYGLPGSTVNWDLKNERGEWVTSGIYVYQAKTPSGEVDQGYFCVVM
jgi:hypothetical protein